MVDNKTQLKLTLDSFDDLELAREPIVEFCRYNCSSEEVVDILEIAILEACHNAVRYGTKKTNKSLCELKLFCDNQSIKATVINYGEAYKVAGKETFSIDQDFLQYKNGGLGIPLIKSLMDKVEYSRRKNDKNELIIMKKLFKKQ